jgi:glutathione S-transferase
MSAHSQSLILHQYEMSPFSEKIRVIFGMKGLEWHACDQPRIMPKPDLVALTGGYRRIPVLQIGADFLRRRSMTAWGAAWRRRWRDGPIRACSGKW